MYSGAMESQSQIKRCLSEVSAIAQVCGILHQDEVTHRTDLARRLCSHYGFFNAQGQAQIAGCSFAVELHPFRDASDQCSLSRIWGGIHPPQDDIPGRLIGIQVGEDAFEHARGYFEGTIDQE